MRILVVDDNPDNIATALQTLQGHEVTTCSNYEEVSELLLTHEQWFTSPFDGNTPGSKTEHPMWAEWEVLKRMGLDEDDAWIEAGIRHKWYYDAVLLDLFMPVNYAVDDDSSLPRTQEEPVGFKFALEAAQSGARYILVASNENSHDNPDSSENGRLDFMIPHSYYSSHPLRLDNADLVVTRNPAMIEIKGAEDSRKGKDWGRMLACMMTRTGW